MVLPEYMILWIIMSLQCNMFLKIPRYYFNRLWKKFFMVVGQIIVYNKTRSNKIPRNSTRHIHFPINIFLRGFLDFILFCRKDILNWSELSKFFQPILSYKRSNHHPLLWYMRLYMYDILDISVNVTIRSGILIDNIGSLMVMFTYIYIF